MDESSTTDLRSPRQIGRSSESGPAGVGGPAQMANALEALRVASTLLVVLYHAALTYVATPLRLTLWVAFEPTGHVAFDAFIYWVNGFVMPVFFLAAGISAPAACESRGPRTFLIQRAHRLLRPLLFGCLTILPMFYLLWGYGLMVTGRCDLDHILSWRYPSTVRQNLYGLGHLWFLEYLFFVCVAWCLAWMVGNRVFGPIRDGRWVRRVFDSAWCPMILAVPTATIFLIDSDTMLRVDNMIVPNVFRMLHYLAFFAVGAWMSKVREPRRTFSRFGPLYLGLSFGLFGLMWPLLIRHAATPLTGWSRVGLCVMAAVFPWLTVIGGLGVLLRIDRAKGPLMRFLSEASLWVYLIHVPIVALMQLVLLPRAWPIPAKFLVVSVVTLALSFASYGPMVRHSLIGSIINGARKRLPKGARFGPETGWVATLGVLVILFGWALWSSKTFLLGGNLHEVASGQVYRSARLLPDDLDRVIRDARLKSVVVFTNAGIGERHPWFADMKRVCDARRVELRSIPMAADQVPSRAAMIALLDILETSPRPMLVEGYRGIDQVGFASAISRLLDGSTPEKALHQFDLKYGQFGSVEISPLGRTLLGYRDWLAARHQPHDAGRLREWASQADPSQVAIGPDDRRSQGETTGR